MTTQIWHNPRCSKSRQTLQLLQEKGIEAEVFEYLKNPPSTEQLQTVLAQLGIEAAALLRAKEEEAKAQNLAAASNEAIIEAMTQHPKLIERPIVIHNDKAALGRPPENVLALF
ncbi:MAG: arsenate reductase (glutaredoxin) [Gammaproteobacteria bacterium]|nr:arsenate reductase (glutaredoxin) [Gammaproteobacteria bacterium]